VTPPPGRGVRIACAVLLCLWCAASWTLSSQHDPESYVGIHLHLNDKVEHIIEYAAAGFFATGAFGRVGRLPAWIAAVLFGLAWGASDELHQSFVPGRDSSVYDLAADVTGAGLGTLVFTSAARRRTPRGGVRSPEQESTKEPTRS
jgi:VanZ family protein